MRSDSPRTSKGSGKRRLRIAAGLVATALLAACAAPLMTVFGPTGSGAFQLTGARNGDGSWTVGWTNGKSLSPSGGTWTILYGYYVYLSETSPYDGYRLHARLYNPKAATIFTNVTFSQSTGGSVTTNSNVVNFSMPSTNDGVANLAFTAPEFRLAATNLTLYMRVIPYELTKKSNRVEIASNGYPEIKHEVDSGTPSGYLILPK